jgi:hypothetical protein
MFKQQIFAVMLVSFAITNFCYGFKKSFENFLRKTYRCTCKSPESLSSYSKPSSMNRLFETKNLVKAIQDSNIQAVQHYIKKGAEVNSVSEGKTPLDYVAKKWLDRSKDYGNHPAPYVDSLKIITIFRCLKEHGAETMSPESVSVIQILEKY